MGIAALDPRLLPPRFLPDAARRHGLCKRFLFACDEMMAELQGERARGQPLHPTLGPDPFPEPSAGSTGPDPRMAPAQVCACGRRRGSCTAAPPSPHLAAPSSSPASSSDRSMSSSRAFWRRQAASAADLVRLRSSPSSCTASLTRFLAAGSSARSWFRVLWVLLGGELDGMLITPFPFLIPPPPPPSPSSHEAHATRSAPWGTPGAAPCPGPCTAPGSGPGPLA